MYEILTAIFIVFITQILHHILFPTKRSKEDVDWEVKKMLELVPLKNVHIMLCVIMCMMMIVGLAETTIIAFILQSIGLPVSILLCLLFCFIYFIGISIVFFQLQWKEYFKN
jgi:hypothetical protein